MTGFWSIVLYEFLMQIRRRGLWIALVLLCLFILGFGTTQMAADHQQVAIQETVFEFQIFAPLIVGFFLSDRLYRDRQLHTDEFIQVSRAAPRAYIWGKYVGTTGASLFVMVVGWIVMTSLLLRGGMNADQLGILIAMFVLMIVPTLLFIAAFCIALPGILPLRLYQILFVCYWLWALQKHIPSVSGTLLDPSGQFMQAAFLNNGVRSFIDSAFGWRLEATPGVALLNVGLLLGLAVAALLVCEVYLTQQQRRR